MVGWDGIEPPTPGFSERSAVEPAASWKLPNFRTSLSKRAWSAFAALLGLMGRSADGLRGRGHGGGQSEGGGRGLHYRVPPLRPPGLTRSTARVLLSVAPMAKAEALPFQVELRQADYSRC